MSTTVVTARLEPEDLAKLDIVCDLQERSRAWVIAKAIKHYVDEQIAFRDFIKEGEDAIDRGDFLTQEEMEAWFASRYRAADAA